MERLFSWEFPIPPDAIDGNGHVNNVRFVQWMQDIAIAHAAHNGATAAAEALGGTWFARSHRIDYLAQAFPEDRLVAQTWVVDIHRARSRRRFRFLRAADRAVLARAETEWTYVESATGRPRPIPPEVIARFELVGEEDPAL
jgi:acyl-CoA thioester hydrolase